MSEYEKRIKIAKEAVKTVRTKTEYSIRLYKHSMVSTSPSAWAIGVIGILDFVLTGDPEKILLHEVREEVKRCLANEPTKDLKK